MFWLISFHSFDAQTQIRTGYSGAQHRPLQHARHCVDVLGVPVTTVGPVLLLASALFPWKHCLSFYPSIFTVLHISLLFLLFYYLVRHMEKMGVGEAVMLDPKGSDSQILWCSINCLVISMNLWAIVQLLKF